MKNNLSLSVKPERNKKILVAGYYGEGNLGDELILLGLVKGIKDKFPDGKVAVKILTGDPQETRLILGDSGDLNTEKIVYSFARRKSVVDVLKAVASSDVVVLGGGGLFQDFTSSGSLYYYLVIILLSKLLGKKVSVVSVGIDQLKSFNRVVARFVLKLADNLSVRDRESAEIFANNRRPRQFADLALNFGYDFAKNLAHHESGAARKFVFVPRRFDRRDDSAFWARLADMCARRYDGSDVAIAVFHKKIDEDYVRRIVGLSQTQPRILRWEKPSDIIAEFASADLVVSARLHGIILAAALNVPLVGISSDRKSDLFLKEIEQKNIYRSEEFDRSGAELAFALIADALRWSEDFRQKLSRNVERLRKLAREAVDYAFS